MNVKRGDVVLLDYPFSDSSGSKVRPALVVQSDQSNAKMACTIVALITKNLRRVARVSTQLLIDIQTQEGKQSGLRSSSAVTCTNLYTVHERHIFAVIGRLPANLMLKVNDCLRSALELA